MDSNWFGAGLVGFRLVFSVGLEFKLLITAQCVSYFERVYVNTRVSCRALITASDVAILVGKAGKRSAATRRNVKGLFKSLFNLIRMMPQNRTIFLVSNSGCLSCLIKEQYLWGTTLNIYTMLEKFIFRNWPCWESNMGPLHQCPQY